MRIRLKKHKLNKKTLEEILGVKIDDCHISSECIDVIINDIDNIKKIKKELSSSIKILEITNKIDKLKNIFKNGIDTIEVIEE